MKKSKWLVLFDDIWWTYSNPPNTFYTGVLAVIRLLIWHLLIKKVTEYFIGPYHRMNFLYDCRSDGGAVAYIVPDDDFRLHEVISHTNSKGLYIDIGANVGTEVLLAAQKGMTVHAFEPTKRTFANLEINVILNSFSDKVLLHQQAVSNKEGKVKFFTNQEGIALTNSLVKDSSKNSFSEVVATTLDRYVKNFKLEKIDLVKVDVEGAEQLVFEGAKKTLEAQKIQAIFWETNPQASLDERQKSFEYLSKYGYRHFGLDVANGRIKMVAWDNHHDCLSLLPKSLTRYKTAFS